MAKKKKHVQTEKERLFQEEAARKRAEKAEAAKRRRKRDAWFVLAAAFVCFAVALGFAVWTVARMLTYETNYLTVKGTVVDYTVHKHAGENGRNYTLVIAYTVEGKEYRFSDTAAYRARPTDMIGNTTDIYVNPQNPEHAKRVSTASSPSFVSAIVFPFGGAFYALGMALMLQERGSSVKKRLLCIWLPLACCAVAGTLLFWIGLPNDAFWTVFARIDGAVGFAVSLGLAAIAAAADAIVSNRMKRSRR